MWAHFGLGSAGKLHSESQWNVFSDQESGQGLSFAADSNATSISNNLRHGDLVHLIFICTNKVPSDELQLLWIRKCIVCTVSSCWFVILPFLLG